MPRKSGFRRFVSKHATAQNAQRALKIALMTKSLLNVEYKHVDTAVTTLSPDVSGAVYAMTACAEGSSSNQRNGLSIRLKSLYLRAYLTEHASADDTCIRLCIIKARQPRGTTPTISDIFESSNPFLSLQNNVKTSEYQVLYSKFITFSSSGTEARYIDFFKKLNMISKYNGSSGTTAELEANQLYLAVVSNRASATAPTVQYTSRIRFIDN